MCGIVGYISKKDDAYVAEKEHFMRFALALDTLRGHDSTGIMTVSKKFDVHTMKTLMPGDRFVHSDRYKKKWEPGWAKVGHNRAATFGKVTVDNAHPFVDGPIALVHNGTLWAGGRTLPKVNDDLEVDSAQIAHNFALHKPGEASDVLREIDGAFALVWFDTRDRSINMARNSERPMHYAVGKERDVMWFMSDGAHLSAINKSFGQSKGAAWSVYELDKHIHLKWKKGEMVPEVAKFAPFVINRRPAPANSGSVTKTTTKTKTSGSKPEKTALERATEQWEKNLRAYDTRQKNTVGYPLPTVHLAGRDRLVPKPMLKTLRDEYELGQEDHIKFTPCEVIPFTNRDRLVIGEIEHPRWGDCKWSAIVVNANQMHAAAYMKTNWVVRPIGVGKPWNEVTPNALPTVMCHLVNCDWKGWIRDSLPKQEAQDEGKVEAGSEDGGPESDTGFVLGPQQIMIPFKRAKEWLQYGCISCGYVTTLGDLSECQIVNEGRDLLCGGCVQELKESIPH